MKPSLLSSVALVAFTLPAAAQDPSCRGAPTELTFSHYEDAPKPKIDCGGGIIGRLDCVTEEMANAGAPAQVGATYKVKLIPTVERLPDGSRRVKLELGEPSYQSDAALPDEQRGKLERERRLLEANLKRFEKILPPAEGGSAGAAGAGGQPRRAWRDGEMILLPHFPNRWGPGLISHDAADAFRNGRLPGETADAAGASAAGAEPDVIKLPLIIPADGVDESASSEGAAPPQPNIPAEESGRAAEELPVPLPELGLFKPSEEPEVAICDTGPASGGIIPVLEGMELPEDVEMEVVEGENPGEYIARFRMPDGSIAESEVIRFTDENGAEIVAEMNPHGDMRETRMWPDGTLTSERTSAEGDKEVTTMSPEGQIDHIEIGPDGGFIHHTVAPDGSIVTEYRDPSGGLIETVTQRPDGWVERVGNAGNVSATLTDENGTTVVETDRSGNTLTARFDKDGNLVEQDRHQTLPSEPGRAYFEKEIGGTDWDQLSESRKQHYADRERDREQMLLNRAQEDAAAAREKYEAAQRDAADAALTEETDRKLAAIAAEQAEADRKAAERQAKWDRHLEIEASREKAEDLQKQYDEAAARGDKAEMRKIIAEQDKHHEASHELLQPNEEEARAMDAETDLRQRIASEVYKEASDAAAEEIAENERWQDYKDAVTAGTQYVSAGSEMQKETSRTTRMADRELAMARSKRASIEKRLNDPATPAAEREVLQEMLDVTQIQEDGAAKMLTDNARITAAGYLIDAAQTATGASLVTGAAKAGGKLVVQAVSKAAATGTAQVTKAAAVKAANALSQGGMKALNVVGLDDVAAAAGRSAADLAGSVGRGLATDISTPIVSRIGSGLDNAARSVMAKETVDAAQNFLRKSADTLTSDVTDLPGKLRRGMDPAAASRVGANAIEEGGEAVARLQDEAAQAGDAAQSGSRVNSQSDTVDVNADTVDLPGPQGGTAALDDTQRIPRNKSPAEMTVAERRAYDKARGQEALDKLTPEQRKNWYDADGVVEDDVLPGPMEPSRGPDFTPEEIEYLHKPGQNYTGPEIQRKAELYRRRQDAAQAVNYSVEAGMPPAARQARLQEYNRIRDAINNGRAAHQPPARVPDAGPTGTERISRPGPDAGPSGTQRLPNDGPNAGPTGTQRLPDQGVDRAAQTQPDFRAQNEIDTIIDNPRRPGGGTERMARPGPDASPSGTQRLPNDGPNAGPTGTQRLPDQGVDRAAQTQPDFRAQNEIDTIIDNPRRPGGGTERIARPTPDAGPTGTQRLGPDDMAGGGVPVPRRPDAPDGGSGGAAAAATPPSGPLHGDPTMDADALRSFAQNPRVRTQVDPTRVEHASRNLPRLSDEAALKRAEWLKMPGSARRQAQEDMLSAVDEAAAMGDKWAKRLQKDINDGKFAFEYEPGLDYAGLSLGEGKALLNPLDGARMRSGDEMASILVHEYAHSYGGSAKWAAHNKPGFVGSDTTGQYNEIRAFLSEGIFNRNLAKARQLNGKPFDDRVARYVEEMLSVDGLPAAPTKLERGRQALSSLQERLVQGRYGQEIYPTPQLQAENLSMFRGGSRKNINKLIREGMQEAPDSVDDALKQIVEAIAADGGGQFLRTP